MVAQAARGGHHGWTRLHERGRGRWSGLVRGIGQAGMDGRKLTGLCMEAGWKLAGRGWQNRTGWDGARSFVVIACGQRTEFVDPVCDATAKTFLR